MLHRTRTKVIPLALAAPLGLLLLIGAARPPQDADEPKRVPERLSREEIYADVCGDVDQQGKAGC